MINFIQNIHKRRVKIMKNMVITFDFMPPEAMGDLKEFQKKFDEKYKGFEITEILQYEMNYDLHCFEKYIKDKYHCPELRCKINNELGFHEETWTVKELCEIYKKHYPERYIKKEKYTKREVNNMLFNLQIIDLVDTYSPIYQYNSEIDDSNEIYDKNIHVMCRYFLDD